METSLQHGIASEHSKDDVINEMRAMHWITYANNLETILNDGKFYSQGIYDQLFMVLHSFRTTREDNVLNARIKKSGTQGMPRHKVSGSRELLNKHDFIIERLKSDNPAELINVICEGHSGTGKSNYALSIIDALMRLGFKTYFTDYSLLMNSMASEYGKDDYEQHLSSLAANRALVLDSFLLAEAGPANEAAIVKDLIDQCEHKGCALILTSNRPLEQWGTRLGKSFAAEIVLDRLMNGPLVLHFNNKSLRQKEIEDTDVTVTMKEEEK